MTSTNVLRRPPVLALASLLALVTVQGALAQGTGGRLRGQVTDNGTPLPGVTVTVTSGDLIGGSRFTVTGTNGTYSFPALPVGDYTVKAELDSYQSQQTEDVRVSLNGIATVNFSLPAAFSDEVVVTGEAPLVQLSSSSSETTYDADFIEDLPLTRFFWDMMAVSPGVSLTFDDGSNALSAFGSGVSGNQWQVDGVNANTAWLGASWWYVNPDTIEEVQVLGIGAGAEFGEMTGAAFNVVTKSGGNETEGRFSLYVQDDSLTDANVTLDDNPFPEFHREEFVDTTFSLGGPFKQDRAWYYFAGQYFRNSATQPGVDPATAPESSYDRLDAKVNFRFNDRTTADFKLHFEDWSEAEKAVPGADASAREVYGGDNPATSFNLGSILSDRTFSEFKYSYWTDSTSAASQTGSTEPMTSTLNHVTGTFTITGGIDYPGIDEFDSHQVNASLSHFAENLMGGDHDFKFGVHYSQGSKFSEYSPGPEGAYYYNFIYSLDDTSYNYYYKYYQQPYQYGSEVESLAAFIDDSWQVNGKLTVNAGVRFDSTQADIPAFDRLDNDRNPTGEKIDGYNAIDASNFSPRFGFAYNPDGKTVIRGSAGIYRDKFITANWEWPPPDMPPFEIFLRFPPGDFFKIFEFGDGSVAAIDPDVNPPTSLQISLGFERQIGNTMSYGVLAVYKDTEDLLGWEILDDGVYTPFDWENPLTGEIVSLLEPVQQATVRKGNGPGFTVLGPDKEYYEEYEGLVFSFNRRHADGWSMRASYTLSESRGLHPNYHSNFQGNGLFGFNRGSDPNDWLNADQLLQGDRKHMFRLQANFDLPWNLTLTTSINLQSGRAYSHQGTVRMPYGGNRRLTLIPASDDQRFPSQEIVDVALGRIFKLNGDRTLRVDLQAFNLLNDDAVDRWVNLTQVGNPLTYLLPRRVMVRFSLDF